MVLSMLRLLCYATPSRRMGIARQKNSLRLSTNCDSKAIHLNIFAGNFRLPHARRMDRARLHLARLAAF